MVSTEDDEVAIIRKYRDTILSEMTEVTMRGRKIKDRTAWEAYVADRKLIVARLDIALAQDSPSEAAFLDPIIGKAAKPNIGLRATENLAKAMGSIQ